MEDEIHDKDQQKVAKPPGLIGGLMGRLRLLVLTLTASVLVSWSCVLGS